jgi:glycosyltransferase involved in cell wall biosynthesis
MSSRGPNGRAGGVLQLVLSLEPGGTERLVVDISNRLVSEGVAVHVCCLDGVGPLAEGLHELVTVHMVPRGDRFTPALPWQLAGLTRRLGVSVLHCHQYTPFVYGCSTRLLAPTLGLVFTEHGRLVGAVPSPRRRRVNRFLTRVGGLQFAVSEELRHFMLQEGYSPSRVGVIHNGIEPTPPAGRGDRGMARRQLGVLDDDFVVGTSARFDPVKDLPTLVEAAAIARRAVPSLKLVIMGDGAGRQDIEDAVRNHQFNGLILPGYLSNSRALLPALDVYVNCSLSEGISVAVLEAMDAAVAVVATAVGGTPEILRDGIDGRLVPSRSPESLAAALVSLAGQPEQRRRLGDAGRIRVQESFSAAGMLSKYMDAYQRAARWAFRA